MIIERIEAENVLKYARLELTDIPDRGLIAVIGDNESGKSSIGESICFALFGRTFSLGPDELDKVIRWGESRCAIKLDFRTPDGGRYQVARFLDELGNHGASISRPGEQPLVRGLDAVAERLKVLIGFGYTELIESFYLAQREISTPKPHSDAVKAMAGIDALERVAVDCRREAAQTAAQRAETAREHADMAAQVEAIGLDPQRLPTLERDQESAAAALAEDRRRMLALKSDVDQAQDAIARVKEVSAAWLALEPEASYRERRSQNAALATLS
ncbi:MAG: AAA family ATPase, partial [Chromatiaceae bacterium]